MVSILGYLKLMCLLYLHGFLQRYSATAEKTDTLKLFHLALLTNNNFVGARKSLSVSSKRETTNSAGKYIADSVGKYTNNHIVYFQYSRGVHCADQKTVAVGVVEGTCIVDGSMSYTVYTQGSCSDDIEVVYYRDTSCQSYLKSFIIHEFTACKTVVGGEDTFFDSVQGQCIESVDMLSLDVDATLFGVYGDSPTCSSESLQMFTAYSTDLCFDEYDGVAGIERTGDSYNMKCSDAQDGSYALMLFDNAICEVESFYYAFSYAIPMVTTCTSKPGPPPQFSFLSDKESIVKTSFTTADDKAASTQSHLRGSYNDNDTTTAFGTLINQTTTLCLSSLKSLLNPISTVNNCLLTTTTLFSTVKNVLFPLTLETLSLIFTESDLPLHWKGVNIDEKNNVIDVLFDDDVSMQYANKLLSDKVPNRDNHEALDSPNTNDQAISEDIRAIRDRYNNDDGDDGYGVTVIEAEEGTLDATTGPSTINQQQAIKPTERPYGDNYYYDSHPPLDVMYALNERPEVSTMQSHNNDAAPHASDYDDDDMFADDANTGIADDIASTYQTYQTSLHLHNRRVMQTNKPTAIQYVKTSCVKKGHPLF